MSLSLQYTTSLSPRYTKAVDLVPQGLSVAPNIAPSATFADGTLTGQVNKLVLGSRVLAASAVDNLNLSDGSLLDPFGAAMVFTVVKVIYVRATVGANGAIVGGATSNAFVGPFGGATHKLTVPLGSWLTLLHPTTGWAVGAAATDVLRIAAGASGVSYDFALLGVG